MKSPGMKCAKSSPPWAVAVYVLIRDSKGRVLLVRRRASRAHFPGCWELPGGKPARGESIVETALIEAFEESGLCVELKGVAGAVEGSIPGLRVAMLILETRTRRTTVTLSDEHDEFRWLPLHRVRALKLRPGFDRFFATYSPGWRVKKRP